MGNNEEKNTNAMPVMNFAVKSAGLNNPTGTTPLPGLAATMEVAGIESIPEAHQGPMMVGYSRDED
jgi:hypothetical protein